MFDEECSELANKRKQTKLLCLQNPNNQIAEEFSNVRRDTCRMFRKKKRDYMKAKDNKLEKIVRTKTLGKCIRGLMNSRRAINLALM